MGLRYRKSIKIGPARINFSKSGVGYSVGTKGLRYTKTATGRDRITTSIPGTGISYVKESSSKKKVPKNINKTKNTISDKSDLYEEVLKILNSNHGDKKKTILDLRNNTSLTLIDAQKLLDSSINYHNISINNESKKDKPINSTVNQKHSPKAYKICGNLLYLLAVFAFLIGIPTFLFGGFVFCIIGLLSFFFGWSCKNTAKDMLSSNQIEK